MHRAEVDGGLKPGTTTDETTRLVELEPLDWTSPTNYSGTWDLTRNHFVGQPYLDSILSISADFAGLGTRLVVGNSSHGIRLFYYYGPGESNKEFNFYRSRTYVRPCRG